MTDQEIIQQADKGGIDMLLEYKKGNRTRAQIEAYIINLMELARIDERATHAKKHSKQYKVKFSRGYGGWTDNAVVITGTKQWVARKFCTNWLQNDQPPKEVEATVPEWLWKLLKTCPNVSLLEELN